MELREIARLLQKLENHDYDGVHDFLIRRMAVGIEDFQEAVQQLMDVNVPAMQEYLAAAETQEHFSAAIYELTRRRNSRFSRILQKAGLA